MHLGIATERARLSITSVEGDVLTFGVVRELSEFLTMAAWDFAPRWGYLDVECAVVDVLCEWAETRGDEAMLDYKGLMKHSELLGMMTKDKEGNRKDFLFLDCARKCQQIREQVKGPLGKVSEQGRTVTLDPDDTSKCYQWMGESMLTNELLPAQKREKKYKVRYDELGNVRLSDKQRSWADMMLRKKLGDKWVATFIWIHGLPPLFRGFAGKTVTTEMLQSALHHGTEWYASLIQSVLEYDADPKLEQRRDLGALQTSADEEQRKQALRAAVRMTRKAKALVKERESHKRKFEDMRPEEQCAIEELETGVTEKKRSQHLVPSQTLFRGKVRHSLQ